ncbi:MAG: hypothetical protein KDA28_00155, partial [Phycisphaerales bacterium]|nr:hypothetical protein [Phycisphaerales bacterium]
MPINQFSSSRRMLPVALTSLVVLSVLPARFNGWVSWFAGLTDALLTPVSDPAAWVSRWMVPAATGPHDPEIVERLRAERDQFERMWLAERERRRELERFVTENDEDARWTIAQVVGVGADLSSGLLKVRAGSADGVVVDSVATFNSNELVGRVVETLAKTCYVQPITDARAGRLEG